MYEPIYEYKKLTITINDQSREVEFERLTNPNYISRTNGYWHSVDRQLVLVFDDYKNLYATGLVCEDENLCTRWINCYAFNMPRTIIKWAKPLPRRVAPRSTTRR